MLGWLSLWACTGGPAPDAPVPDPTSAPVQERTYHLEFGDVRYNENLLTALEPTAAAWANVDLERASIGLQVLRRRGEQGFGDRFTASGAPIEEPCNNQDFDGLVQAAGHWWLVSHFECTPGEIYVTRVSTDPTGKLVPELSKRVDFASVGGVWNPCAGQPSPWGTHLASEEYEPDASFVPTSEEEHGWDHRSWAGMQRYLPEGTALDPYQYGWIPEVTILDAEGSTKVVKHKALGRFSHEIAYVLPDERTVYLSDDGTAGGWFMFVADRPKDLSAGWLYAARLTQESEAPFKASIKWIPLGHADDAFVDGLIARGITFTDLFERAEPNGEVCPPEFYPVKQDVQHECLKLAQPSDKVADVAKAASRLETRRYAAIMGATTELEKGEGVTYDPVSGRVYLALSKVGGRMLDEGGGPSDHVRLPENACGMIAFGPTDSGVLDSRKTLIGSKHVMTSLESLVIGTPIPKDAEGNTCLIAGIANPDNLAYLPGYDILMIAEDTSAHAVASLWALELRTMVVKRILVAPPHGEVTGISWARNVDGRGWLTVAIQHPWKRESLSDTVLPAGVTEEHQRSITGVIGPFPKLD